MNTDNNGSISDNISHVYFGLELKMQDFKFPPPKYFKVFIKKIKGEAKIYIRKIYGCL